MQEEHKARQRGIALWGKASFKGTVIVASAVAVTLVVSLITSGEGRTVDSKPMTWNDIAQVIKINFSGYNANGSRC